MSSGVSVIIPSFQGAARLSGLLEALTLQQTDRNWEVVLVIDGSTDSSTEVASRFLDHINLTVLDRGFNAGRSVSLNEGFTAAKGAVLIRCDDDLLPGPHYVERFARAIEANPNLGVIGLYRNQYPPTPYADVYGRTVDERYRREAYGFPIDMRWLLWAGNCGVHRQMWELVGPYDHHTFQTYGWEDIDWGYRFWQSGGRIVLDRELETPHRVAATTCAIRLDRAQASGAAARLFDTKHGTSSLPQLEGSWGAVVAHASRRVPPKAWGQVDRVLPVLPPGVGRKLVDLSIQAHFRRGYFDLA